MAPCSINCYSTSWYVEIADGNANQVFVNLSWARSFTAAGTTVYGNLLNPISGTLDAMGEYIALPPALPPSSSPLVVEPSPGDYEATGEISAWASLAGLGMISNWNSIGVVPFSVL